jgi:ribosomal protein S18 acetylase RimI-like enzyme
MIIERARLEDAPAVLALQKTAYRSEAEIYGDHTIPPLAQTLDEIAVDFMKQFVLKASVEGRIVGSVRAYAEGGTCFIGRLVVYPEFQNQGIGSQLMEEVETRFGHAERFELFTGHKSERNLRFYEKRGYEPFRRESITENLTLVYLEKRCGASPGAGTP